MFSGAENTLLMSQTYSVTYNCDFDLLMFPFDAQVSLEGDTFDLSVLYGQSLLVFSLQIR